MLGRNLKLSRNVSCNQSSEKAIVIIVYKVIVANTRADEHLFNSLNSLNLRKKPFVLTVVNLEILAGCGSKTLLVFAQASVFLTFTGGEAEVCGGAAYIVDISLESGKRGKKFCLFNY